MTTQLILVYHLTMIMCSSVANTCLQPHYMTTYDDLYKCMIAGYTEAIHKTQEIGVEEINEHEIYIKFHCKGEFIEKKGT